VGCKKTNLNENKYHAEGTGCSSIDIL